MTTGDGVTFRPTAGKRAEACWSAAAAVLGSQHPVARSARLCRALARQLVACGGLVALGVFDLADESDRAAAALLTSIALVVELFLVGAYLAARSGLREHVGDLIAGGGPGGVAEVEAERRRIAAPRHRARLVRELTRALQAAEHWDDVAIGRRPPPSVCRLDPHAAAMRDVVGGVAASTADVRAIALVDRLLRGGYAAPLYVAPDDTTARDLGRIRFLLADQR